MSIIISFLFDCRATVGEKLSDLGIGGPLCQHNDEAG